MITFRYSNVVFIQALRSEYEALCRYLRWSNYMLTKLQDGDPVPQEVLDAWGQFDVTVRARILQQVKLGDLPFDARMLRLDTVDDGIPAFFALHLDMLIAIPPVTQELLTWTLPMMPEAMARLDRRLPRRSRMDETEGIPLILQILAQCATTSDSLMLSSFTEILEHVRSQLPPWLLSPVISVKFMQQCDKLFTHITTYRPEVKLEWLKKYLNQ